MSDSRGPTAHLWNGRRTKALALFAASAVALALASPTASPAAADPSGKAYGWSDGPSQLTDADAKRLGSAKLTKSDPLNTSSVTAAAEALVDPIHQRILVVATTGDPNPDGVNSEPAGTSWDFALSTLTNTLDYLGMPYDTYKSSTKQLCRNSTWKIVYSVNPSDSSCTGTEVVAWGSVTADRLWDQSVTAYYSGVMLASGNLVYTTDGGATYPTGMTPDEWAALWTFEAAFGIRMVSAYTSPTPDYGMTYVGESGDPTTATWTAAGRTAFPYVTTSLPIENAYIYQAAVDPAQTSTTTPILNDGAGNVLGVIKTYPEQGNRQALALTFNSARYLTHGLVLGYGLVNWVTKGQFVGFRKATLDPQIDDIFIEDDIWWVKASQSVPSPCSAGYVDGKLVLNPSPEDPMMDAYRIKGSDLSATIAWQSAKQGPALTKALKLSMPFNGEGSVAGYSPSTLDPAPTLATVARNNQGKFKWINHSYDHPNLNTITYTEAATTITLNNQVAKKLRFTTYNKVNFVQPDISGLDNPAFLQAAYDQGVRNLISDKSRTGNPGVNGPNEVTSNATDTRLFEVPRYPVNLYYNASTPEQDGWPRTNASTRLTHPMAMSRPTKLSSTARRTTSSGTCCRATTGR